MCSFNDRWVIFSKIIKNTVDHHNLTDYTSLSEKTAIPIPAIVLLTYCGLVDLWKWAILTPYWRHQSLGYLKKILPWILNYADDNCLSYAGNNVELIEKTFTSDIDTLRKWFKENSLEANPVKFQSMLISSRDKTDLKLDVSVDGTILETTESIKILGVTVDRKLNFNDHVSQMCTKAEGQLHVLQRLKGCLDYNSHMAIYKTFIMSNFNYCPVIWMFTSKASISKLETLQKRALRFVLNDYESTYQNLLHNCNVPGIKILLLRNLAIEVYKWFTSLIENYLRHQGKQNMKKP